MKTALVSIMLIVVLGVAGFAVWRGSGEDAVDDSLQLSPAGRAALALAESRGCIVCHSVDGSAGIGPTWKGSYGNSKSLQDGSSVLVDDVYLRRSMKEPAAQVVTGFENVMVPPGLSDAEIDALTALIAELGTGNTP